MLVQTHALLFESETVQRGSETTDDDIDPGGSYGGVKARVSLHAISSSKSMFHSEKDIVGFHNMNPVSI